MVGTGGASCPLGAFSAPRLQEDKPVSNFMEIINSTVSYSITSFWTSPSYQMAYFQKHIRVYKIL